MAGQNFGTQNLGGYTAAPKLSKFLRESLQPSLKFRQLCDARDATMGGKNRGNTFMWNSTSGVATPGAALTEGVAIPQTNVTISNHSLTVTEYGLEVPYTGKLEDLSEQDIKGMIKTELRRDAAKTLDKAAYAQFDATPLRVAPTGGNSATDVTLSTNGATAITNDIALKKAHVRKIVTIMEERDIPAYMADDYVAVGRPSSFAGLKEELEGVHQYTESGMGRILNGEIGRFDGVRFVKQTNVSSEAWANGKSDGIFFMGEDTVIEAVVVPEEIRGKIPGDYGRDKGFAWYYNGGFGLMHPAAAQARVIKWDSAA
jgi:N4-gp56 family major capsid protein